LQRPPAILILKQETFWDVNIETALAFDEMMNFPQTQVAESLTQTQLQTERTYTGMPK
jgi:hypothetical protein